MAAVSLGPCGGWQPAKLTDCPTPGLVKVTVVLLRVLCPCFSEETPSDLLVLRLPFPRLALASVQGPGVEVRGGHPGRVGRGENGLAGGRREALILWLPPPGLRGVLSMDRTAARAHRIKYIEVIRL